MPYYFALLGSAVLSAIGAPLVRAIAIKFHILDVPNATRKAHSASVPLLGGFAIYAAIALGLAVMIYFGFLPAGYLHARELAGIMIAGAILVIGGALDDKIGLRPLIQFLFPLAAVVTVLAFGIHITYVKNPFGGIIDLGEWSAPLTFLWLLGLIYTTKLLDGLDGLATGVGAIGCFFIFALALRPELNQPETALLSLLVTGALLGFLPWNFHPARIFLGEGGSTLIGFLVGVLAIVSGSKVATTLLVIGIPAFDVLWIMWRRAIRERKSITQGDRKHLHFRLLEVGFSHRGAVIFLWIIAAGFGGASVFLQTGMKLLLLGFLGIIMLCLVFILSRQNSSR